MGAKGCGIEVLGMFSILKCIVSLKMQHTAELRHAHWKHHIYVLGSDMSSLSQKDFESIDIVILARARARLPQFSFHRWPQLVH